MAPIRSIGVFIRSISKRFEEIQLFQSIPGYLKSAINESLSILLSHNSTIKSTDCLLLSYVPLGLL
jgi:hypothetical protein